MKLKLNEFLAVVYADIFSYSLRMAEAQLWSIESTGVGLKYGTEWSCSERNGYLFLSGRQRNVFLRREHEKIAQLKKKKAYAAAKILARIPTVEAVFLTGSVAVGNSNDDADIDLLVVTSAGLLWLTRMAVVGLLRLRGVYRSSDVVKDRICTNIFLDGSHLEVPQKNIYTAHEVLQAQCVFDRGYLERSWIEENFWVKSYLPEAFATRMKNSSWKTQIIGRGFLVSRLTFLLFPLELLAFLLQYLYMREKITHERVGWRYAWFHPADLSVLVNTQFLTRLKELGVG